MMRSSFFHTLAALLAGTHAAGPTTPMSTPAVRRRCLPAARTAPPPRCCATPPAGACR